MLSRNEIENYLKDDLTREFGRDEGNAMVDYILHWWSEKKLTITDEKELESMKKRLLNHEPVQYVAGWTEFAGMEMQVNPSVLIPRPETEELVFLMKDKLQSIASDKIKALDIGTGSGCIALALKNFFPQWKVTAVDASSPALATAGENARLNNLEIEFLQKDILNCNPWHAFDVVVSNPPYVTMNEKEDMQLSVTAFEPHDALFVNGDDPLQFYKSVIRLCKDGLLKSGGRLFFEIHYQYGNALPGYLAENNFTDVHLLKDLSGNSRFVWGIKNS